MVEPTWASSMQANSNAATTQCGSTRMQIYLNHFGLSAINEKL